MNGIDENRVKIPSKPLDKLRRCAIINPMTNTKHFSWNEIFPNSVYEGVHSKKVSAMIIADNVQVVYTARISTEDGVYRKSDFVSLESAKNWCDTYFGEVLSKEV